jgi:fructokinase
MRIGVDLGGTKTEIAALLTDGRVALRRRVATPAAYGDIVASIVALVEGAEAELDTRCTVGVGLPGSPSPATGLIRNANTQCLNGRPFPADLAAALGRPVRVANDANCLAISEAADGAGAGAASVFAVIIGTGCGGGLVFGGRLIEGVNGVAGEWGHTPLPWMTPKEYPGRRCWCGQPGCLETWLSGPALAEDWRGEGARDATGIAAAASAGDAAAAAALARHADRMARALASVVNLFDPEAIVLAGGLSRLAHCEEATLAPLIRARVFGDVFRTRVLRALHGDSSGVFGAARLWD